MDVNTAVCSLSYLPSIFLFSGYFMIIKYRIIVSRKNWEKKHAHALEFNTNLDKGKSSTCT